jgi:hypothetical protein
MSDIQDAIRFALAKLDTLNDDHWTENGLPRLDALGFKEKVTRVEVTAAAPLFTRANPAAVAAPAPAPNLSPESPANPTQLSALPTNEELDKLQAEIALAHVEVEKAQEAKTIAMRAVELAQAKRDRLLAVIEKARPPHAHENIMGIRAVLERSQIERQAKGDVAKELRAAGITAALLQSGSKLDQAMARKRGLGGNRPSIPLMKQEV